MNDKLGIYIHIPFCIKKCAYCDFCSYPEIKYAEQYANALITDIKKYAGVHADTLYIGGGTPTCIASELLTEIVKTAFDTFSLGADSEISVECNPGTADLEYFHRLKDCGVNRLSIGMQSAVESELKYLGRIHGNAQTKKTVYGAKTAGIENINLDLMYGIPYQTEKSFEYSLNTAISLEPSHISAYALKVEEGTELYRRRNDLPLPSEDSVCDMLDTACTALEHAGLHRYEISNFAIPGKECVHNLKYWRCKPYLSFGPSASSYFDGKRYTFNRSLSDYIAYANGEKALSEVISEYSEIPKSEHEYEYIMLGLRLSSGISDGKFKSEFGISFGEKYGSKFEKYIRLGLAEKSNGNFRLNGKGMLVSNAILSELI